MTFNLGDRVRTLFDITSGDWAPEQPDIPAGALGTIDYIGLDQRAKIVSYGVILDASVDRLSAWMDPTHIEAAQ